MKFKEGQVYFCIALDNLVVVGSSLNKHWILYSVLPASLVKEYTIAQEDMIYIGTL